MEWIKPAAIFDGSTLKKAQVLAVENGKIVALKDAAELPTDAKVTTMDALLSVGLFDIQINGGGGTMLNNDPTPAGVRKIVTAHRELGTVFTLPTVITDTFELMEKAAFAVLEEVGNRGVLGIHIEGPHISMAHKGIHQSQYIRPFDDDTMGLLETLRNNNMPTLLTLAPECAPPGLISKLCAMGITVSAGHSAATADQTEAALAEGLTCFTHLFNAMPQMTSRQPGITAAAINSTAWCGIIADGHHVDARMLALAIRARPKTDRMILVSDAMASVGGPEKIEICGEIICVKDGRLVNAAGTLAGAHIDLKTSVERLVNNVGVPVDAALRMATSNPRELMGLPAQPLVGSALSDLTQFPVTAFPHL